MKTPRSAARISSSAQNNESMFRHTARKRFGQNFLHDQNVIANIIDSIAVQGGDHLVEIGPGQGALTRHLISDCSHLDVIEVDRDLANYLRQSYSDNKNFTLHRADILKFDLSQLTQRNNSLRIIGNLPYNISTPCLFHLLQYNHLIKDMTFMLQLEVVQRLAAQVGDKNYGRLGLMVQYYCQVQPLFNVPSSAFRPKPKVVSAVVRLVPHERPPSIAKDVDCLKNVIRTAFTKRRKTLKNSLKGLISEDKLNQLPINITLRPENLSLAEYILISDSISTGLPVE